ncbi:sortase [Candidatus Nomurabacteria bacterium]|nr:sortase [Candidatus Nomurabacteria bacterium]
MKFSYFFNQILPSASAFLGVFFIVMMIGYGFLYFIDFVPEAPEDEVKSEETVINENDETSLTKEVEETPVLLDNNGSAQPISITLGSLDRTVSVLNPTSRSIPDLDAALLKGVVRHPDSADLNDQNGNMLILGHSSYLNNVFNKNYQAFNGIQNMTWGDTITLKSADTEYTYRVDKVYQAKASAVSIPTTSNGARLTLATCNTFGAKEDRFIVEAVLVSKKAL